MTPGQLLAALERGEPVPLATQRQVVKATLLALTNRAPGRSVEVRIPPLAAVQAVAGASHRRGTPSAVVETDPATWLALALGEITWQQALAGGRLTASGNRSDLSPYLPLVVDP